MNHSMPLGTEPKAESKIVLSNRLRKEGRWEEATLFKDEVMEELHQEKIWGHEARRISWAEVARRFPPLKEEKQKPQPDGQVSDSSFGILPKEWVPLPETADWQEELDWAYQNGFFVIAKKPAGGVSYIWERARSRPPSQGALVLMTVLGENRNKFMDLLKTSKTGGDGTETEGVKREKRRIEEIENMLEKLEEEDS